MFLSLSHSLYRNALDYLDAQITSSVRSPMSLFPCSASSAEFALTLLTIDCVCTQTTLRELEAGVSDIVHSVMDLRSVGCNILSCCCISFAWRQHSHHSSLINTCRWGRNALLTVCQSCIQIMRYVVHSFPEPYITSTLAFVLSVSVSAFPQKCLATCLRTKDVSAWIGRSSLMT